MKYIIVLLVLFAVSAICFSYISVNGGLSPIRSWQVCFLLIMLLFISAAGHKPKTYGYMISFFHSSGNGRAFITSNSRKIDCEFILELENRVAEKYGIKKVLAISVQRMEVAA